jgi:putative membrane protein
MRVEGLFEPASFERIKRAVRDAEEGTAGEIVPMIVVRSYDYPGIRAVVAAIVAFSAGVIVLGSPLNALLWLPPTQIVAFAAAYWVAGRAAVLRFLLPASVRATAVSRAAHLAFLDEGLVETRDRTGILIYLSLLEHRVEVVADRGIHERVGEETWNDAVRLILDGIRSNRAEEGLIDAIQLCGEILSSQFPPRDDDTDELPDRVRP